MSTGQPRACRLTGVSEWLAAVHEPNRMAVLLELACGERTQAELAAAIGPTAANLGTHIQKLRAVGLADYTARGVTRIFRLTGATVTPRGIELCHPAGVRVILDRAALAATMRTAT